ncbi:MAG: hypothetical protein PF508_03870, partial [Spirochaeta sp.]|nr:hypothetical protein [Spirochaeta sp.]
MHDRNNTWLSLGALLGSDADPYSLTYEFSHARCAFSVSGDEWTKIELALREAGAPESGRPRTGSAGYGGGAGADGDRVAGPPGTA